MIHKVESSDYEIAKTTWIFITLGFFGTNGISVTYHLLIQLISSNDIHSILNKSHAK